MICFSHAFMLTNMNDTERWTLFFIMTFSLTNLQLSFTLPKYYKHE